MAFLKIVEGAIEGERPWSDVWADIKKGFSQLGQVVVPALETFVDQFLTDFGSQALALAEPEAQKIISGEKTIEQAAADLIPQIAAVAVTTAEKDGTVALNALRVHLTALQSAPVALTPPEDTPPVVEVAAASGDDAPIGQTDDLPPVESPSSDVASV